MEALFHARIVCPEILSRLVGRPASLSESALVFWQDAVSSTKKAFALNKAVQESGYARVDTGRFISAIVTA